MIDSICGPALLYIAFSLTHILIDLFKSLYNTAFLKFVVMIIFTIILNLLCQQGLSIISWFIVFIPFIFMSVISSLLLIAFGLNPQKGYTSYNVDYPTSSDAIPPVPNDPYTDNNQDVNKDIEDEKKRYIEIPEWEKGESKVQIDQDYQNYKKANADYEKAYQDYLLQYSQYNKPNNNGSNGNNGNNGNK